MSQVTNAREQIEKARAGMSTGSTETLKYPLNIESVPHKMILVRRTRNFKQGGGTIDSTRVKGAIVLPTPLRVIEQYSSSYQSSDLGNIGNMIAEVASDTFNKTNVQAPKFAWDRKDKGTFENMWGNAGALGESVSSLTGGLQGAISDQWNKYSAGDLGAGIGLQAALNLTSGFGGFIGAPNAAAGITAGTGLILNPHRVALFTGVELRSFNYSWRFSPKSDRDSLAIENINRELRDIMLPPRKNNGILLGFPDEVEYKILGPASGYDMPTTPCVITGVSLDRTAAGEPAFFAKTGAPVMYNLSLSLMEIKALTRDDFKDSKNGPLPSSQANTASLEYGSFTSDQGSVYSEAGSAQIAGLEY